MQSLKEIYKKYSVIGDTGGGDKGTTHSYIEHYEKLLEPYRKSSNFLEIGMWEGSSLKMG